MDERAELDAKEREIERLSRMLAEASTSPRSSPEAKGSPGPGGLDTGMRRMAAVMKRWQNSQLAIAVATWQRAMSESDIIHLHHNMQWDTGTVLLKHTMAQLLSGRLSQVVLGWRRRQLEAHLEEEYRDPMSPTNKKRAKELGRANGQALMGKVLKRWQNLEKGQAISSWQRNMADSDIINLHHQLQWDSAARLLRHVLMQWQGKSLEQAVRQWTRQAFNSIRERAKSNAAPMGEVSAMRLVQLMALECQGRKIERCIVAAICRWDFPKQLLSGLIRRWRGAALKQAKSKPSPPKGRTSSPKSTKGASPRSQGASVAELDFKASENEAVYWSMRDHQGGYSLHGSRRAFHFKDTSVKMVAFANDQWLLALALSNFTIHIAFVPGISVTAKAVIASSLRGHTGAINSITWSSNNEALASASSDSTIRIWSNPGFECTRIVDCGVPLTACIFHPTVLDVLAVANVRCMVELFNTRSARVTEQIEFAEPIRALTWSPKGEVLFMGDDRGKLNAYRYGGPKGQMVKAANIRVGSRTITHIASSKHLGNPKATILLVNTLSNMVLLCNFEEKRNAFGSQDSSVTVIAKFPITNSKHGIQASFCPTIARWSFSHNIVSVSEDGTVFIFNLENKKGRATGDAWINQLMGHNAPVVSSAWSGDGGLLVTADALGSVVIWFRDASGE